MPTLLKVPRRTPQFRCRSFHPARNVLDDVTSFHHGQKAGGIGRGYRSDKVEARSTVQSTRFQASGFIALGIACSYERPARRRDAREPLNFFAMADSSYPLRVLRFPG